MKLRSIILILTASLAAGAIALLAFRIVAAYNAFIPPEPDLPASVPPRGDDFAPRLCEELGYTVRVHRLPYDRNAYSLIIRRYEGGDELDSWRDWLAEGKRLILLCTETDGVGQPRRTASSHPLLRFVTTMSIDPDAVLDDFPFPAEDETEREIVFSLNGKPALILEKSGRGGEIVYIADGAVFNDRNLILGDNLQLLNNCLVDHYGTPIAFDYASRASVRPSRGRHGEWFDAADGAASPFFLFRGNFLILFIELVFLGVLFILIFWKRFGPARDPERFARRSLLRHLKATGDFYEKTSNPLVIVDIFDRYFLARLREILHLVSGNPADLENETKRLLLAGDETLHGEGRTVTDDAFVYGEKKRLTLRDAARERIILKLKGVDTRHAETKNPR